LTLNKETDKILKQ